MNDDVSHRRLLQVLKYNPATGKFHWRIRMSSNAPKGRRAGSFNRVVGRWYIRIDGVRYLAARLAWFYVHGRWPSEYIDHKNLKPSDDRLTNLRECSHAENMFNRPVRAGKMMGLPKGVFLFPYNRYAAQMHFQGKKRHLGYFSTAEAAGAAYARAAAKLHGEFFRVKA